MIRLKRKWFNKISNFYRYFKSDYIGSHIRTFGYFKDIKDDNVLYSFNETFVFVNIIEFWYKYKYTIYLASDSSYLKKYIYEKLMNRNISVTINPNKSHHSYINSKRIDKSTIFDIEILSNAHYLILTLKSTYSITIYIKNKNCNVFNCKFISPFQRNFDLNAIKNRNRKIQK